MKGQFPDNNNDAAGVEKVVYDATSEHTNYYVEDYKAMNEADRKRATQSAYNATRRAATAEKARDYAIAAGFYRNAAALWRVAGDEQQSEKCQVKADEMDRLD